MLRPFLCLLCLTAIANSSNDTIKAEKVEKVIQNLIKKNRKVRSIVNRFHGYEHVRNSEIAKMVDVKIVTGKDFSKSDTSFSHLRLETSVTAGVNTLFSAAALQDKYLATFYSSEDPSINDIDKIATEYLDAVIKYKNKKNLLNATKEYVETKKRDLGELTIRMQHGDLSKDELSEAMVDLKEAENTYTSLADEVAMLESFIAMYITRDPSDEDAIVENEEHEATVDDLEAFIYKAGLLKSNAHVKSEHSLSRTFSEKMAAITEFTPQMRIAWKKHLTSDAEMKKKDEKDSIELSFFVNLSPSRFFDTLHASRKYEAAKLGVAWERAKEEYELRKYHTDIRAFKAHLDALKASMESKKIIAQSVEAQFKGALVKSERLRQARSDYQKALKTYHDNVDKYVDAIMKYLAVTGKLREVFFDTYPEFRPSSVQTKAAE